MKTTFPLLASAVIVAALGTPLLGEDHKNDVNDRNTRNEHTDRSDRSDRYSTQGNSTATPMFARSSEIVGLEVRNKQDEKLGKVQDVVVDVSSSRVVGLIVSTGGVLGVGGTQTTVPLAAFRHDADRKVLLVDMNADMLKNAPAFSTSGWQTSSQPDDVAQLYRYYQVPQDSRSQTRTYESDSVTTDRSANRGSDELTPLDQGNSESDRQRTADIRKAVMDHTTLSLTGKNVKIITIQGRVTLRGSVPSESEREQIVKLAESIAPGQVTDQLQVDAKSTQP